MKAWRAERFGDPVDVLRLRDMEIPEPRPGWLTVEVSAAGVALPDVLMLKGAYPLVKTPPVSPGMEAAGTVVAAGDQDRFVVGDRIMTTAGSVLGWGGFAQYCLADAGKAMAIPAGMTDLQAAGFVIPFKTAHMALVHRSLLRAGETLLVLGAAGSSGAAAVQLGKALGARTIAVASSASKLDFCRSIGADFVVNYTSESLVDRVQDITAGAGADVVFDPVGGELGGLAMHCTARRGRYGLIGFASGAWPSLDQQEMVLRNFSVVGIFAGMMTESELEMTSSELVGLAHSGMIATPIGHVFPFDEAIAALTSQERGDVPGKLILEVA